VLEGGQESLTKKNKLQEALNDEHPRVFTQLIWGKLTKNRKHRLLHTRGGGELGGVLRSEKVKRQDWRAAYLSYCTPSETKKEACGNGEGEKGGRSRLQLDS